MQEFLERSVDLPSNVPTELKFEYSERGETESHLLTSVVLSS